MSFLPQFDRCNVPKIMKRNVGKAINVYHWYFLEQLEGIFSSNFKGLQDTPIITSLTQSSRRTFSLILLIGSSLFFLNTFLPCFIFIPITGMIHTTIISLNCVPKALRRSDLGIHEGAVFDSFVIKSSMICRALRIQATDGCFRGSLREVPIYFEVSRPVHYAFVCANTTCALGTTSYDFFFYFFYGYPSISAVRGYRSPEGKSQILHHRFI